ncbi:MAG: UTP--glucose-1-phosphate uridylyltransferase GalU [Candidatus Methylomirabilis oxygeniifera]|uniref:UTP--glucose-1-phosphate uridylyltransferase n=1 Tax=Methylomirabilis oxygeniifera TaxID=671143 RepID=D5MK76_METO1|nr:MAG: UTP--glucose-1-phosphate uridylyltransferase GalU [Candidatus Methylomirabilis oxyfera]CBE69698.1 glucose-1-phosphate uridylyltransferase [Candidatus Methylomirabilis oxyfera]
MRIRKAIVPAAGLGTRFLPATKAQPKEMLPIVDKPTIQYVVEEAAASGIEDIIIVTGRGKDAIENHFDRSLELQIALGRQGKAEQLREIEQISELASFCYIRQEEPLGLGHAILTAKALVGNEPFAVLLGDDIIDAEVPCLAQMIAAFERYRSSIIAVQQVSREETGSYGIIDPRPAADSIYQILDLVEKPTPEAAPSNLAIIGRYILTPEIFEALERTPPDEGGEIQLTNGLRVLLSTQTMYGLAFRGRRYDAGSKLGFVKATVQFALKRPDLAPGLREYLKTLSLDEVGAPVERDRHPS